MSSELKTVSAEQFETDEMASDTVVDAAAAAAARGEMLTAEQIEALRAAAGVAADEAAAAAARGEMLTVEQIEALRDAASMAADEAAAAAARGEMLSAEQIEALRGAASMAADEAAAAAARGEMLTAEQIETLRASASAAADDAAAAAARGEMLTVEQIEALRDAAIMAADEAAAAAARGEMLSAEQIAALRDAASVAADDAAAAAARGEMLSAQQLEILRAASASAMAGTTTAQSAAPLPAPSLAPAPPRHAQPLVGSFVMGTKDGRIRSARVATPRSGLETAPETAFAPAPRPAPRKLPQPPPLPRLPPLAPPPADGRPRHLPHSQALSPVTSIGESHEPRSPPPDAAFTSFTQHMSAFTQSRQLPWEAYTLVTARAQPQPAGHRGTDSPRALGRDTCSRDAAAACGRPITQPVGPLAVQAGSFADTRSTTSHRKQRGGVAPPAADGGGDGGGAGFEWFPSLPFSLRSSRTCTPAIGSRAPSHPPSRARRRAGAADGGGGGGACTGQGGEHDLSVAGDTCASCASARGAGDLGHARAPAGGSQGSLLRTCTGEGGLPSTDPLADDDDNGFGVSAELVTSGTSSIGTPRRLAHRRRKQQLLQQQQPPRQHDVFQLGAGSSEFRQKSALRSSLFESALASLDASFPSGSLPFTVLANRAKLSGIYGGGDSEMRGLTSRSSLRSRSKADALGGALGFGGDSVSRLSSRREARAGASRSINRNGPPHSAREPATTNDMTAPSLTGSRAAPPHSAREAALAGVPTPALLSAPPQPIVPKPPSALAPRRTTAKGRARSRQRPLGWQPWLANDGLEANHPQREISPRLVASIAATLGKRAAASCPPLLPRARPLPELAR